MKEKSRDSTFRGEEDILSLKKTIFSWRRYSVRRSRGQGGLKKKLWKEFISSGGNLGGCQE